VDITSLIKYLHTKFKNQIEQKVGRHIKHANKIPKRNYLSTLRMCMALSKEEFLLKESLNFYLEVMMETIQP